MLNQQENKKQWTPPIHILDWIFLNQYFRFHRVIINIYIYNSFFKENFRITVKNQIYLYFVVFAPIFHLIHQLKKNFLWRIYFKTSISKFGALLHHFYDFYCLDYERNIHFQQTLSKMYFCFCFCADPINLDGHFQDLSS